MDFAKDLTSRGTVRVGLEEDDRLALAGIALGSEGGCIVGREQLRRGQTPSWDVVQVGANGRMDHADSRYLPADPTGHSGLVIGGKGELPRRGPEFADRDSERVINGARGTTEDGERLADVPMGVDAFRPCPGFQACWSHACGERDDEGDGRDTRRTKVSHPDMSSGLVPESGSVTGNEGGRLWPERYDGSHKRRRDSQEGETLTNCNSRCLDQFRSRTVQGDPCRRASTTASPTMVLAAARTCDPSGLPTQVLKARNRLASVLIIGSCLPVPTAKGGSAPRRTMPIPLSASPSFRASRVRVSRNRRKGMDRVTGSYTATRTVPRFRPRRGIDEDFCGAVDGFRTRAPCPHREAAARGMPVWATRAGPIRACPAPSARPGARRPHSPDQEP